MVPSWPIGTNNHIQAACHGHSVDASDKGSLLSSRRPDAYVVGLAPHAQRADVDVIAAGSEICTRIIP